MSIGGFLADDSKRPFEADGRRLADARFAAGFKRQEAFAEKLGLSRQAITDWETGKRAVPARKRSVVAKLLGVAPEQIWKAVDGGTIRQNTPHGTLKSPHYYTGVLHTARSMSGQVTGLIDEALEGLLAALSASPRPDEPMESGTAPAPKPEPPPTPIRSNPRAEAAARAARRELKASVAKPATKEGKARSR